MNDPLAIAVIVVVAASAVAESGWLSRLSRASARDIADMERRVSRLESRMSAVEQGEFKEKVAHLFLDPPDEGGAPPEDGAPSGLAGMIPPLTLSDSDATTDAPALSSLRGVAPNWLRLVDAEIASLQQMLRDKDAAIQAVREWCDRDTTYMSAPYAIALEQVRDLLDGAG